MRIFTIYLLIAPIFCFGLISGTSAQETETEEWPEAVIINAYDSSEGDFLDVDLENYRTAAFDIYQSGDYENAAKYYLALLKYDITDGSNIYNLACCYGLLGDADLAAKYLERAVKAGFTNIDHIQSDPDFDSVRGTEIFDSTVDGIASMIEEKASELGEEYYTDMRMLVKFRIRFPENYDPEESYPLVVGLHGLGDNSDGFITLYEQFENPQFIFVAAQAPYVFDIGGAHNSYSWEMRDKAKENLWETTAELSETYIVDLVDKLKFEYKVSETYLLGFSQGCRYAYQAGLKYPDHFDGLICFSGQLLRDWIGDGNIGAASGLRIFICHGVEDTTIEIQEGMTARDLLTEFGFDVTYYEFDGGHEVPDEACHAAQAWLME